MSIGHMILLPILGAALVALVKTVRMAILHEIWQRMDSARNEDWTREMDACGRGKKNGSQGKERVRFPKNKLKNEGRQ